MGTTTKVRGGRRQATDEQRAKAAERRARMRALADRIGKMDESEREAMAARAGLRTIEGRSLSPFNQCMVIMQDSGATVLGGFQQWRKAGRQVRKGGHGVAIWVPIGRGGGEQSGESQPDGEKSERPGFMLGTIFDISQTEPIEAE